MKGYQPEVKISVEFVLSLKNTKKDIKFCRKSEEHIMAVLRAISSFLLLRLIVFAIIFLVLLYIAHLVKLDSFSTINEGNDVKNELKRQKKLSPQSSLPYQRPNIDNLSTKYNLMEEKYGKKWSKMPNDKFFDLLNCTIEYVNVNQLQQDHPCVIHLIRRNYIRQPSPSHVPYKLEDPMWSDPSNGQSEAILRILRKQTNGFFVECGGYDGEFLSNTLYMERSLNWSGLLIEADKKMFRKLINRNRKAFTSPVCLSTDPYPKEVEFNASVEILSYIVEQKNDEQNILIKSNDEEKNTSQGKKEDKDNIYKIQCFPLYSILLAINRTYVDYFSLDIEGAEFKVLYTIPWHKVYIKTLTVEWNHVPEGEAAITSLMEKNQYIKFGRISMEYSHDVVYVKDFLRDLRMF